MDTKKYVGRSDSELNYNNDKNIHMRSIFFIIYISAV